MMFWLVNAWLASIGVMLELLDRAPFMPDDAD
jgi:hypothetical protein